jgi:hypothetical protein
MDYAISRSGSGLPSRIVLHGTEGIGKSTFGAFAPKPVFAMTNKETGLLTLLDNGLVPATDHFDEIATWPNLLGTINYLLATPRENRTFVLDTINGAERLCFEHVAKLNYQGDWEKFINFGKGPNIASNEYWPELLEMLEKLRRDRRMMIILLAHSKVKTFKNPFGDDYDRFVPEMHEKTWGHVAKWADIIMFGNFDVIADKAKGELKAKGKSDGSRSLYTVRSAAYDAKNRHGLPTRISMGKQPHEGWANFAAAMKAVRKNGKPEEPAPVATSFVDDADPQKALAEVVSNAVNTPLEDQIPF